ncbi:MAG: hypothetical protein KGL39_55835 [Patescibacteria group bacterium]|nr:hypothetical protein [Patescibacteria group bacterium]
MIAGKREGSSEPINSDILERVDSRLKVLGLSGSGASKRAGLSADALRDLGRYPERSPTLRTMSRLADVLGVAPSWLAFGVGLAEAARNAEVPVKGEVAAGLFRFVGHSDEAEFSATSVPPDLRYPEKSQFDLVVRGTSINQIARDGDYLRCVDLRGHRASDGDLVIIQQTNSDGAVEATAKICVRKPEHVEFWPASDDDRWKEPIVVPRKRDADDREIKVVAKVLFVHRPLEMVGAVLDLKTRRLARGNTSERN